MNNEYMPKKAMIEDIKDETSDVKTFSLRIKEKPSGLLKYRPGQFMILSLPGCGEAPFTFASPPTKDWAFQVSVKKAGSLTDRMHGLKPKDTVGVRGPYGNSLPIDKMKGRDILFVAGGIGMAPLRPAIRAIFGDRKSYGKVEVVYGARTPKDLIYKDEVESWRAKADTEIHLTVDVPDESWGGSCGVVCVLFPRIKIDPKNSVAIVCGPPLMIRFAIFDILKLGFKEENIYASLERYMKCGIGKCGHCYIKGKYVCTDGPNFSYAEMKSLGIAS